MPFSQLKTLSLILITAFLLTGCDSESLIPQERISVESEQPVLIINGHTLPPEPDPKENNATLLGVDSNNNGVRDDVERWIYQKYKDKRPIYIDIAMQEARAWQMIMRNPPSTAKTTTKLMEAAIYCQSYYKIYAKFSDDPILVTENIIFDAKVLNTIERKNAYITYDKALSGGVYSLPHIDKMKSMCDFDTSKYGKNND